VFATALLVAVWFCLLAPTLLSLKRSPAWVGNVAMGFTAIIPGLGGVIMVVFKLLGLA
jgi:hypothetical protein